MDQVPSPSVADIGVKPITSFLMLGKTGSGKSTLINAFVNHFYKKLYKQEKEILIPFENHNCSFPDYEQDCDKAETDETKYGQSRTPRFHIYQISSDERTMIIMDTPGMGDTRGFEQDKKHIKCIIDGIKEAGHLQTIIFVVDNECKLNPFVKFYVDEIKKIMTKPCLDQCIVVCTKHSGKVPKEVKKMFTESLDMNIPDERWFAIDNTAFLEEPEDENAIVEMTMQWNRGRMTFDKIYEKASTFSLIPTEPIGELLMKRRKLDEEILNLIAEVTGYRGVQEIIHKDINRDIQDFVMEESKERHSLSSRSTNYNCHDCDSTCIESANYVGYAIGTVLTLSLFHWISEKSLCIKCQHPNSRHRYEKVRLFVGLGEMEKRILAEMKEEAKKAVKPLTNEEIISKLQEASNKKIKEIARLADRIAQLGIIPVTYDSFLDYLEAQITHLEVNYTSEGLRQLEKLQAQKEFYTKLKEQYLQLSKSQTHAQTH